MDPFTALGSNDTLLYDEANHISSKLLQGEDIEQVRLITLEPKGDLWQLTPKVNEYVRRTGLQHLAKLKKGKIDMALINALIERWRPETNTFHLGGGEMTITLEDMSYLYGLPVDGKAVTGPVWSSRSKLEETVLNLLGVKVDTSAYLRGGQLSLPWIQKKFSNMPSRPTAIEEIRYARAYLFCLVASQLSTNNAGARGHGYLLEIFADFERYTWAPACLACVYRSLTRATQIKDRLCTITGPLHLLQIWAYSRTAIGRPIRVELARVRVDFPLFKMWQTALSTHRCSSTIQETRNLLDKADGQEDFEWQPYRHWTLQLNLLVDSRDQQLFRCTTPLVYFWIVERHNVDRVYKQFGLRQPVPPPFHRWERINERASKDTVDYGEKCKKFVDAWEARGDIAMITGADDGEQCHDEHYLIWYRQASGRSCATDEAIPRARVENALAKVDLFLQFGAGSIALLNREQSVDLYEQSMRVGRKMQEFREAVKSFKALEEFNLASFTNDDDNNGTSTGNSSSDWSVEEVLKITFPTKQRKEEPSDRTVRHRTPAISTTTSSSSKVSKGKRKLSKERDTDAHIGTSKSEASVEPLVSPYPPSSMKGAEQPNREYQLAKNERSLLEKFWKEYQNAPDGILESCSYISAQDLYLVLQRHWISTTVMDYWLSINLGCLHGVHLFPSTLAIMRDRGWSNACSVAFNFCHSQSLLEFDALLFPVWHQSHFYLLVAYPRLKRWDYYNTMGWRKRHWVQAQAFKEYVSTEFALRGWTGTNWELHNVASCPQQGNSDDCGVFVMAIADHLARRRDLRFTQADMWYFRQKIVVDIYHRQLDRAAAPP